jgi:hypothetical protein
LLKNGYLEGLIPHPLLPGEKGSKNLLIRLLAPLPRERGWGEAIKREGFGGVRN